MNYDQKQIIEKTIAFVKASLAGAEGGHDWWHTYRVLQNSRKIAKDEDADIFVCELGALLHDVADPKFHNGDEEKGSRISREFLQNQGLDISLINRIIEIIENISFAKGSNKLINPSLELKIVQDADRLDAMGAIGIARAFNYGGFKNRQLYDPGIQPATYSSSEEYRNSNAPTINHFYEKLLLLENSINTVSGKQMAKRRHKFLIEFLKQFFDDWAGRK